MADVFISYSRKDQPFVRKLFQALTDDRHGVWVDWEGIPITDDWWREIRSGVEAADNFLFVTSPNSLESPICHLELAYASQCHKRIIPVVIADPDEKNAFGALAAHDLDDNTLARLEGRDILLIARDNWRIVSRHNWMDFRDSAGFAQQVKGLITAIGMDLDHVRQHTRLLVRAEEWADNEHVADFLLRGEDLADAQAWLERGKGKSPAPTPPHLEFIQASATHQAELLALEEKRKQEYIKAANRAATARRWLVVAGIVAAIVAVIAGLSFDRAQRASAEAGVAVNNAQTATIALGQAQINAATATFAQGQAECAVATAQTQLAVVGATLTPIPPTLTAIAQEIAAGKRQIDSLRWAAAATTLLETNGGNIETATLLGIRALKTAYSPQADAALVQAVERTNRVRQAFTGHTDIVSSVAVAPDGKTILTGSYDQTAHLWDITTGKDQAVFSGHSGPVTSVAFAPDGKTILTGSNDTTARLWDAASTRLVQTFNGHSGPVTSVAFAPDGKTILTGSNDTTARLWDADSGRLLQLFSGHSGPVTSVAFGPEGTTILTGSGDGTARLWDTASAQTLRTYSGNGNNVVASAVIAPNGKTILAGLSDGNARLWDMNTGEVIGVFSGHSEAIKSVAFASDSKTILTGSTDDTARLWDVASRREIRIFSGHAEAVAAVNFTPDGKSVVTGSWDKTARLWDIEATRSTRLLGGHTGPVTGVALASDGKRALTVGRDKTIHLWSTAAGESLPWDTLTAEGPIRNVIFAPDNLTFLTTTFSDVQLWDVATGKMERRFVEITGPTDQLITSAAFAPDGKTILTWNGNQTRSGASTARLWDVQTGQKLRQFMGHTDWVWQTVFSPDGKTVLTGSGDRTAQLWDISTGQSLRSFTGHAGEVTSVAFAPDGKTLVTGSRDTTARLWDVASGRALQTLSGHTGEVTSIAFAPDGKTVLTGSFDKTVHLWDIASGRSVRVFTGHTSNVTSVAFAADGRTILTGSEDMTARLWDTDYRDFIVFACAHVYRDFTDYERWQFNIVDHELTCPLVGDQSKPLTLTAAPIAPPTITTTPTASPGS